MAGEEGESGIFRSYMKGKVIHVNIKGLGISFTLLQYPSVKDL